MNLNYNINNALLSRNRNFFLGKVGYVWTRGVSVAAGIQSGSIIFGTGSITYTPYAPTTLFVSGTYQAEQLGSGSALGIPVRLSVTGSGVWPVTGSNVLYINVGGNLGFNNNTSSIFTAAAGNMNLSSGSRISSSFTPTGNQEFNIDFGLTHIKGNIYNPLVKFKTQNTSPVSTTALINGNTTASFNIVKDVNVPLAFVKEVSSSFSSQFDYQYNFGVTSSLTASIENNVTGSTTMSIEIPEAGVSKTEKFFNATSPGTKIITGSFAATTDATYNLTASVTYNKGNISTASINYQTFQSSTTQDLEGNATNLNGVSSSFELKKDATIQKAYIAEVSGSVKSGSYNNDYAFNQTASLTQNSNNTTGSVTMSIVVPEAGINIQQRFFNPTTTQALLTASFEAQTIVGYNVTASVVNNKGNESNADISWNVTGSNANGFSKVTASFQIVKDANVQMVGVNDVTIQTGSSFQNQYAFNITASFSGSFSSSFANADSSSISTTQFLFKSDTLGFNITSISSSINLTQSFEAQTNVNSYDITASAVSRIESSSLVSTYTIGAVSGSSGTIGEVVQKDIFVIGGLKIEAITNGSTSVSASMKFFTSSIDKPGNFNFISSSASSSNGISQSIRLVENVKDNYFPWPFQPTFEISPNTLQVAYWGKPSMYITGSVATTYISASNISLHTMQPSSSLEFSSSVVPTTGSHLLAETMTVGGGGRGGTKDAWFGLVPSGRAFIFSGGGGAGGYILANNYFQKGVAYNIVVGAGSPRWDGTPAGAISPTSGSDTYIVGNGATIQLSKGGGNGGPVTGSGWDGPDINTQGASGRAGGSAGGGGYVDGQARTELGAGSITGSVSNIFEVYGAFEGNSGGTAYSPFRLPSNIPNAQTNAGGGGGASQDGFDNLATTNTLGAGGLGKYDLSFTMQGVAGGGAGANYAANGTGSLSFGGGDAQRYTVSGSLIACDGVDGTGGGGGGLISGSLQPGQAPFNYTTKGGSGKVQIRYVSSTPLASGGTIESGSISGSLYILHTFTASGTFTPNL
jgi:hypothetical protein